VISEIYDDRGCTVKHYNKLKGTDGKEVFREIIDSESEKNNVIIKEALRFTQGVFK